MKDFFKTFGKGILYFILFPFLLIYLVLLGVYLFFKNIYYIFYLKSKKFEKDVLSNEETAQKILDDNRYEEVDNTPKNDEVIEEHHEHNSTINNYIIADEATLKKILNGKPVTEALEEKEKEAKELDLNIKNIESNTYVEEISYEDEIDEKTKDMSEEERLKYHCSILKREENE